MIHQLLDLIRSLDLPAKTKAKATGGTDTPTPPQEVDWHQEDPAEKDITVEPSNRAATPQRPSPRALSRPRMTP